MERVRPVVYVLGSEQFGSLEDQLVSHWGSTFTLQFRSHFKDEVVKRSSRVDLNKSLLPGDGWVKRWTEDRPSVIVDVLAQLDPSAVALAQGSLKASGIAYYVILTSGTESSMDCVYPLSALPSLKEAILDSSLFFYKDKAKRYRKWVQLKASRFPVPFGSLVRYNVKAAWMEELALDLPSAVRAYHVAYSALVEAAKSQEQSDFIGGVRGVSDYLARKIVCGLARSGSPLEADAYLRNHHNWSKGTPAEQMENLLAVAESFARPSDPTSPLIPGHYYLQAINLARTSSETLNLANIRSMLTLAFDSYKSEAPAKRHLIYISLLSADLFEHGQNMEMLSQAVKDEKWDQMASLMLRGLKDISVQSAWFSQDLTDEEEILVGCLESGTGNIQFGNVMDTCHLPCAMRFIHKDDSPRVQVTLCNMSPIVISLESIILSFRENEEMTIHAAEEIIPGATYSVTQSVDGPDRVLRLAQLRLQCGNLTFRYSASALCTVETLYLLPIGREEWNRAFLKSLRHYWERSKMNIPKPRETNSGPNVTCSAVTTLATRTPIKFTFTSNVRIESLQILGCDHGACEAMSAPFTIDDGPIEITWTTPGLKSILFEARTEFGETRSFCQQFQILDPFKFTFDLVRRSIDVSLLTVDVTVQIDGIRLTKWDLWDSSSGTISGAVNPVPSKDAYMPGDILRVGFILASNDETDGDLVFRVGWSTDTIAQCTFSEHCPSHLCAAPAGLMLETETSLLKGQVGERISVKWTLKSNLDTPSIPLTLTISDHPSTDPEHEDIWLYEGPCVIDLSLEPGQSHAVEAWVTGLRPGQHALPIVEVTPTNPSHAMHPITHIEHPPILIIPGAL